MMTIYFASYLLAATVLTKNVANGAVFYQILEKDPAHPNECYDNSTGLHHHIGSKWSSTLFCSEVNCSDNQEDQLILTYQTCAYSHVDPPCTLEEDLSLEYPECCPKPVCPPAEDDEELDDNGNGNDLDLVVYDLEVPEQTKQTPRGLFRPTISNPVVDLMQPR